MKVAYDFIDNDSALAAMAERLAGARVLALDTEFMRTDTFYPIPALLQVSDGTEVYLLDPLGITDWQPLVSLLTDPDIFKVMHSVSEDLEVFQRLLGLAPKPLLDTQVGAALASLDSGMGYQRLVAEVLGEDVDKGETRSDWLKRPLSDAQCRYAALDVVHLLPLYRSLRSSLEQSQRFEWWLEEGERQVRSTNLVSPQTYYRRVKSAWKLAPVEQARLKALCAWREGEARERDVPRGRVLKDALCFDIARRNPKSPAELSRIKGLNPSVVRRFGEAICDVIAQAPALAADERLLSPPAGEAREQLKQLKQGVDELSAALSISRDVIMSKKVLEETVRLRQLPAESDGWRAELLADVLNNVFSKSKA